MNVSEEQKAYEAAIERRALKKTRKGVQRLLSDVDKLRANLVALEAREEAGE